MLEVEGGESPAPSFAIECPAAWSGIGLEGHRPSTDARAMLGRIGEDTGARPGPGNSMTMTRKGPASADQVIQTYQRDSKLVEITSVWPDTPVKRVALVHKAQRPADLILSLAWELWELDESEFHNKVYSVWSKTATEPIWSWTFGDMFKHIDANPTWVPQPFDPKKWAAVQSWRPGMKATPPPRIGPLIAYKDIAGHINLEDGHTRLMAAHLEGVFPPTILLYLAG